MCLNAPESMPEPKGSYLDLDLDLDLDPWTPSLRTEPSPGRALDKFKAWTWPRPSTKPSPGARIQEFETRGEDRTEE
jgi:hypothetical protein